MALTHVLLLEFACASDQLDRAAQALQNLARSQPLQARPERLALAASAGLAYAYLRLHAPQELAAADLAPWQAGWQAQFQAAPLRLCRLQEVLRLNGHSHSQAPLHHYAVETDPENGWEDEIFRWYDQEHLPGLAAVPGCTLAQRLINHDAGPRSHACYGLLSDDTLDSPPWLAVRHTDWSSRCRPHFTNTRRSMFGLRPL